MSTTTGNGAPPERLWTVQEVAQYLQVSESWVYKASSRGALPCVRIGAMLRFDPAAIRRLTAPPPPPATVIPLPPGGRH